MPNCTKRCAACIYGAYMSGTLYCNYMEIAGKRRPCPAGDGCTAFSRGSDKLLRERQAKERKRMERFMME